MPKSETDGDSDSDPKTMAELFREHGFDPDNLIHPREVTPEMLTEDSVVVAYCAVRNPDPDAPATTWDVREWSIDEVIPVGEVKEKTDGAVYYPADDTPVTHGVIWSYKNGSIPNVVSIGYGNEMYGEGSEFPDPYRWDRTVRGVTGRPDEFVRFKI